MPTNKKIFITVILAFLSAVSTYAQESTLDVLSYELMIEPDIQKEYIQGVVTIQLHIPLEDNMISFDKGNLEINSVTGSAVQSFSTADEKLLISLSARQNTLHQITIDYHGSPRKGLLFDQAKDQAYTIYSTRDWMICNDSPDDKAKINLKILIPKGQDCIANGELVLKTEKGGKQLFNWQQYFPSPTYTFGFVIGKFQQSEMRSGQVIINNYSQDHTKSELATIFKHTPQIISFFEQVSGVKYDQSSYSQVLIGNHYQEMSGFSVLKESYGSLVLKDSTETNLIAHELAHQWWGNRITCKNWNHFWLNEAVATFLSAAYNEHRFGQEKYNADITAYYIVYDDIRKRGKDKPLVFKSWLNPTRDDRNIVYFKGAYVLHLLRQEIGELAFWEGFRVYSQRYFDQLVTTSDFQETFEEVSERDLDDFFLKWVY